MLFAGAIGDRAEPFAHAPVRDHAAGQLRGLLQIVFGAGAVFVEDQLLGRPAAEHEHQPARAARVSPMFRRSSSGSSCVTPSARPRGMIVTLCTRSAPGQHPGQQRMARLVIGGHLLFLAGEHFFALGAHQDLVAGVFEVVHVDFVFAVARGPQGRFVDQVAEVGAGQADGAARRGVRGRRRRPAARRGHGP